MPYKLKQAGGGWIVVNSDTGRPHSKKPLSRTRAKAQMRALYANVPDAAKAAAEESAAPTSGGRKPMSAADRARHASLVRWGKEQPFAARLEAVRERRKAAKIKKAKGGKGKGAKPKAAPIDKDKQAAENRAKVFGDLGLAEDAVGALDDLMNGVDTDDDGGLVKMGLAETGKDGTLRLTSAGRALYRAAGNGDVGAAKDAASRGRDRAATQQERAASGIEREMARQGRETAKQEKEREKSKVERDRSGGGTGEREKPQREERRKERSAPAEDEPQSDDDIAAETAADVGLDDDAASALRDAAEAGGVEHKQLQSLGLIDADGEATAEGVAALDALEDGNPQRYRTAVRRARARLRREAAQQGRQAAREKKKEEDFGRRVRERSLREMLAQSRSKEQTDRRVAAEVERIAAANARKGVKGQSAQDRAMFANMGRSGGSGGGGGGGGGGKPTGGTGGLWKKGPDGKRTPQAGMEAPKGKEKGDSATAGKPKADKDDPTDDDRALADKSRALTKRDSAPRASNAQTRKLEKRKADLQRKQERNRQKQQRLSALEAEVRGGNVSLARLKEIRAELKKLRATKAIDDDLTPDAVLAEIGDLLTQDAVMDELIEDLEALRDELEELSDDDATKAGRRNSTSDQATIDEGYELSMQLCELFEALGATVDDDEEKGEEYEGDEVEMVEGKALDSMKGIELYQTEDGDELAVLPGYGVKALDDGNGWVGGYLVKFGGDGDLSQWRDVFTKETDFGTHTKTDVWMHHRMLPGLGKKRLTNQAEIGIDDEGVFIKHLLNLRSSYERKLYEDMVKPGKIGWSSGTAPHLVERKALGDGRHAIEQWLLGLDASYTPMPAGGLDVGARALKSLFADAGIDLLNAIYDNPEADSDEGRDRPDEVKAHTERRRRLLLECELELAEATIQ